MKKISLSVVIPCFDEMTNLQKGVLNKVVHFMQKRRDTFEILIVDDGSRDGSLEYIEKFTAENPHVILLKNQHLGKAGAVTKGMLHAQGKYILFTDMDQATPIEELDVLLPYIDKGYDVVIGSRANKRKGAPWTRKFVSLTAVILRKLLIGLPEIADTQCGFKLFTQPVAKKLFTKLSNIHQGFGTISGSNVSAGFDMELLYIAKKMGYKIKEVPISWLHVETRRVSPIKSSIAGVVDLLIIKKNELKGIYNEG